MGFINAQSELEKMLSDLQEEVGDDSTEKWEHTTTEEPAKTESISSLLGDLPTLFRKNKHNNGNSTTKKKAPATETLNSISDEKLKKLFPPDEERSSIRGEKLHVLVVDDDIRVLKLVQEILKADYSVSVAPSGKVALKFLERHGTDLVLLDYMMPEMNGKKVLEKIRANPSFSNLPILFLTGVSDRDRVKECLMLRPKGYMLKPIKQEDLLRKVKSILG